MTQLQTTPAFALKQKYNLTKFVETGCDNGDGTAYAKFMGFAESNIYSCDLRQEAVSKTRLRVPSANLYVRDSIAFLKEILPHLSEPTLFWLDAHFPAAYGVEETAETKMPMIEEISLIKQMKPSYVNDVFICDDMRIFADTNNPRYVPNEIPEYYYIYNAWVPFATSLQETHNFGIYFVSEGIGVFTPKNHGG